MVDTTTDEALADTLRYWVGLPLENRFNDLSCNRVETIFERGLNQVSWDVTTIEARPEYVLVVFEGTGVVARPQEVTDRVARLVGDYNRTHPARPTNDAVELEVDRRRVGTLGSNDPDADLDDARDLLRELGAADPSEVSADDVNADTATADAGGSDG